MTYTLAVTIPMMTPNEGFAGFDAPMCCEEHTVATLTDTVNDTVLMM